MNLKKLWLIFVCILLSSSPIFGQMKGGRWMFENNGNDEATWDVFDNNGSLSGTAYFIENDSLPQGSYALSLEDSANYGDLTVDDYSELDYENENFAVSLWIYPIKGYDDPQHIFMKGDRSGDVKVNNYALRIKAEYVELIVHSESGAIRAAKSSFKVVENEWIFIAVYYDYNQSKLYIWNDPESAPIDTMDFDAPLFPNDEKLYIGTSGKDGYKRFWGIIDDLRLSNKVEDILDNTTAIDFINYSTLPQNFNLNQNYPNPFNPKTIINYELQITNDINLSIYNVRGQKVATLVSERQSAGTHQVEWNASDFPSGVYYYMINAGEFQDVKKMILIR